MSAPCPSRFRRSSLLPVPNRATHAHRSRRPGASSDTILSPPEPMPSPIEREAESASARRPLEIADTKVGTIVSLRRSASRQLSDQFIGCRSQRGPHVEIHPIHGSSRATSSRGHIVFTSRIASIHGLCFFLERDMYH